MIFEAVPFIIFQQSYTYQILFLNIEKNDTIFTTILSFFAIDIHLKKTKKNKYELSNFNVNVKALALS